MTMMTISTAKLRRQLDEHECRRRNALSKSVPGLVLRPGDVGTVLETLGNNEAFLVEFNRGGKATNGECDWLGVLYPTEIEVVGERGQIPDLDAGSKKGHMASGWGRGQTP
jgi:hypothetical protein